MFMPSEKPRLEGELFSKALKFGSSEEERLCPNDLKASKLIPHLLITRVVGMTSNIISVTLEAAFDKTMQRIRTITAEKSRFLREDAALRLKWM